MTSNREDYKPIEQDENLEGCGNDGKQRILVEIVSALCLPTMDTFTEADPYITVSMGNTKLHETKVIYDNPNPIWTQETGSLFLIEFDKDEIDLQSATVTFDVKDYNVMQQGTTLGSLEVKLKELLKGKGKRKEFKLDVSQEVLDFNKKRKRKVTNKTRLVLRFKPPSIEELHFIQTAKEGQQGIFANETFLPPQPASRKADRKAVPQIAGWGAQLLNTRTAEAGDEPDSLLLESMKPSEEWVDVGAGNQGRVYVEVLACDGLPNMDAPTLMNSNNATDAYCCLIMEDSIVNTTIIDDTLSPRWKPSDRRAFVFHVNHPSSTLYLGVFDHDKLSRMGNAMGQRAHDPIGRVLINLTQFQPDTLYMLQYHLYLLDSEEGRHRDEQTHNGTITIRLRVEWGGRCCGKNEAKNMLMAGMTPQPVQHVSVPNRHDYQVARYTILGEHTNNFSINALTDHVNELYSYVDEEMMAMVISAALTVLLWRGHYKVKLPCCTLHLPLHSMTAFAWGILVTQNYNRLFSFGLFAVAWLFLATNEHRRSHPSPWHKCKSYGELFGVLLTGACCGCLGIRVNDNSATIQANENLPAIQSYYSAVKERKKLAAEQKEQAAKHAAELEEEDLKNAVEIESEGDANVTIATAHQGSVLSTMNPLKPILHPVQKLLYMICCYLRITKSIVTWEENYYPFWIATFSLLGSILFFMVPWGFVLRWIFHIAVWVLLGPWMKIVDWLYFGKVENMTADERRDSLQADLRDQYKRSLEARLVSQKAKERALKMRSMMKYLFGQYVVRVPRLREARFNDHPLPASSAEPFQDRDAEVTIVGQICGQALTGDMIPKRMIREHPFITSEPDQQSTLLRGWVDRRPQEPKDGLRNEEEPLLSKLTDKRKTTFAYFGKS